MIFDVISDLLADGRQFKHLVLDDRIVGLLGKSPIHGRLVPEIIRPIHGPENTLCSDGCGSGGPKSRSSHRAAATPDFRCIRGYVPTTMIGDKRQRKPAPMA